MSEERDSGESWPFSGFPFKTWTQGYILGLINGIIIGAVVVGFAILMEASR